MVSVESTMAAYSWVFCDFFLDLAGIMLPCGRKIFIYYIGTKFFCLNSCHCFAVCYDVYIV